MTTNCKHYPTAALQAQYGGQCAVVVHKTVTPHHDGGTLPFTGFDAGLFGVLAIVLITSGAVLRRLGRKDDRTA